MVKVNLDKSSINVFTAGSSKIAIIFISIKFQLYRRVAQTEMWYSESFKRGPDICNTLETVSKIFQTQTEFLLLSLLTFSTTTISSVFYIPQVAGSGNKWVLFILRYEKKIIQFNTRNLIHFFHHFEIILKKMENFVKRKMQLYF